VTAARVAFLPSNDPLRFWPVSFHRPARPATEEIMPGAHEHVEHAEHTEHVAHSNKNVALLIAVIALFLAFSETLGKSAQTSALNFQIEASNLWNFFQAKNIRRTVTIVAHESAALDANAASDPAQKEALAKQIDTWKKTADRYRSEPEAGGGKGEGTVELSRRAIEEQEKRDTALARYHHYEIASAAFQIGIVLCSAAVVTGMMVLAYIAGGLAIVGLGFTGIGLFAPHAVHLF
jgi:hypothetical protein